MQMHVAVFSQKLVHSFGLMRREVVADDVDLFTLRLLCTHIGQERNELGTGMPSCGFAQHLTGLCVERSVEREGAVSVILETMTLQPAGRQRQHRHQTIKRLDRGLFVHAEHCGVCRRIQIKANHVSRLGFEVRIVRGHVALEPMRLQSVFSPDARHHHVRDRQRLSQFTAAPMGRAVTGGLLRPCKHSRLDLSGVLSRFAATMTGVKPSYPLLLKAPFPAADVIGTARQALGDNAPAQALVEHHDQPCALYVSRGRRARARHRQQRRAFVHSEREVRCHASILHY